VLALGVKEEERRALSSKTESNKKESHQPVYNPDLAAPLTRVLQDVLQEDEIYAEAQREV